LKILVVHHGWGYGGDVAVFYYTIKALASVGFEIECPLLTRLTLSLTLMLLKSLLERCYLR